MSVVRKLSILLLYGQHLTHSSICSLIYSPSIFTECPYHMPDNEADAGVKRSNTSTGAFVSVSGCGVVITLSESQI